MAEEKTMLIVCGASDYPPEYDGTDCPKCGEPLDFGYGIGVGPGIGSYEFCWSCSSAFNFRPDLEDSTPEEIERWNAHKALVSGQRIESEKP